MKKSFIVIVFKILTLLLVGHVPALAKKTIEKGRKGDSGLTGLKYKAGDEKGNDDKALAAEILIASQEEKAIQQVEKLIAKYKNTALEPDLLLRLAELHMRRSKSDRFLESRRASGESLAFSPKLVKAAASRKQIEKAIALYDSIEKRFPRFDKLDIAIFNSAFANQQIGQDRKAEVKYLKLLKDHPHSILIPDALLATGELNFQRREFQKAFSHFTNIRKYPDSVVYPYGIYKAAWTKYNMRDAEAALKELEDVIKYGRFVEEQKIDARLDLRREALIDMTLFYEDVRLAKDAYKYFQTQAGTLDVSPAVMRLAELYKRHSRFQDIKILLSDYIKKSHQSDYIPQAYVELMDASDKLKNRQAVVDLLVSFSAICNAERDCNKQFKQMSLGYANKWLKGWQREPGQVELADAAEKSFAIFLKADSNSEESFRARFVYAELLFKRGKYREASSQYEWAGRKLVDVKLAHDARYFAITSLERAVNDKWSDKDEERFKSLAQSYLSHVHQAKYKLDIEFKLAFIAYEKARYDEAGEKFYNIGQTYAKDEKGIKAQDLYLDVLNLKKNYVQLRDYSFALRKSATGKRYETLNKVYEESYFIVIQKNEEQGRYSEAIQDYSRFVKENPSSQLAQKALWNIVQLYYKVDDLMNASANGVAYAIKYPNAKESLPALTRAAQTYESLGLLNEAAKTLELLAKAEPKNKIKWLLLAADFYALSRDFRNAKLIYQQLRAVHSDGTGMRALSQLEMIAREQNDTKERERILNEQMQIGRQPYASLAAIYFAEKSYSANKLDEAFNLAKKIVAQEKSGADKSALARARLLQARVLDRELRQQSLKARLDKIQVVLTLKTDKLSKVQVAYQDAANYGDPQVTVNAYRELADSYLHYAESVSRMPLPDGVPSQEVDLFRGEMQKLAIPMEEKGIEAKLLSYKTAKEFNIDNAQIVEIAAELKKLNQPLENGQGPVKLRVAPLALPKIREVGV